MTHEFISNSDSLAGQVDDFEKNLIKRALEQHQTVSGAARALKVSKSTVSKKCKKYGIKLGV
jgi:transcriptional regulator with PAS, ATPase and Fis domain